MVIGRRIQVNPDEAKVIVRIFRIRVAKNTLAEDVDRYLIAIRGEVQFISDREREIRS
jgi:hypothetical protein